MNDAPRRLGTPSSLPEPEVSQDEENDDHDPDDGEQVHALIPPCCANSSRREPTRLVDLGLIGAQTRAKAEGTKLGRPRISAEIEGKIREQLALGLGIHRVARLIGVGSGTVQRVRASA